MLSLPPPRRRCVYEYETPAMNIDGDFNLPTNSAFNYLPLENVHDELVVPSMCLISHIKRSVHINTCTFLPVQDQTQRSVFECCSTEEGNAYGAIKFWYNMVAIFRTQLKIYLFQIAYN